MGYVTRFHDPILRTGKQTLPAFAEVLHVAERVPPPTSGTIPTNDTVPDLGNATKKHVKDTKPRLDWNDSVDLSHIEDEQLRTDIRSILSKHETMWEPGWLGEINVTKHRIDLIPDTKPIRSQPYRQGPAMREVVAKNVHDMLETDVIETALSEWASPIVLVPKKDGSLRFCIDYRRLNAPDAYHFPRIDDCLD